MSATIESDIYVNYFTSTTIFPEKFEIIQRKFNVDVKYLEDLEKQIEKHDWGEFKPNTDEIAFEHRNIINFNCTINDGPSYTIDSIV